MFDRHHGVLQTVTATDVIVHVACCYHAYVEPLCKLYQARHPSRVALRQVVLELNERVLRSEHVGESSCHRLGVSHALALDQPRNFALATAAQHDQTTCVSCEVRRIER